MAEAASAQQAATVTREDTSQQRAGRRRRTSTELRRAQQVATAATPAAPAALDSLSRLQQLADASSRVAQLQRLQALADASPQMAQLRRLKALADASPQVAQLRRLKALAAGQSTPVSQLKSDPEEEELVQGKFAGAELRPQLQQAPRANNTGLPDQLKSGIESLSGLSMDHVRVHYNSSQPAQLNALAYAQGSDIHLAPGQEQHLPHEAWHVVQQAQGRVRPTLQLQDGVPVNDDAGLEREADVMGEKAMQMSALRYMSRQPPRHVHPPSTATSPMLIQGKIVIGGHDCTQAMKNSIPHFEDLMPAIKERIKAIALAPKMFTFTSWTDVLNQARAHAKLKQNDPLYALKNFKPDKSIPEPDPLFKDQRRYWKNFTNTTFKSGQGVYNSNSTNYNLQKDGRNVHATLDKVKEHNMKNELIGHVKKQTAWRQRNQSAILFNDNVDISAWKEKRNLVENWHISLYIQTKNKGGWFGIKGKAALPVYTRQQKDGADATNADQNAAATIHANMNKYVL